MQMENLPFISVAKRHEETTCAELAVVHENDSLKHVVVKSLCHAVKRPHVLVESANHVEITPRTQISGKCNIGSVVANRRG
jgi:hypothetical protein